ncbi:hypothetical protein HY620_02845 [Candidatus Uhrbacteria bacterium]|nr:hypothetical protein [Candidatus Uhrbacteria bacterium]
MKKGFTVIETLLFVAASGTILLVISLFLSLLISARVKGQTISEVEHTGAHIIQSITQSLRNADSVQVPAKGVSGSSLSFTTPVPEKNPSVVDMSGTSLRITEGAQSSLPLSSDRVIVSQLTFTNLGEVSTPDSIRIQFTLSHANPGAKNEYEYSKTFYATASLRK